MMYKKRLAGLVSLGLAVAVLAPATNAFAAAKPKAKPKAAAKPKATAAPTTKAPAATTPPPAATAAPTPAASGGASGGTAVFAVDAETNNWLPGVGQWGSAGTAVASAVYDHLMITAPDGSSIPFLLEVAPKPSSDYKTWTLTARPGIKFHNGEDFNGQAIADNLEHVRTGSTTSPAWTNLIGCSASGMTATCTTKTAWVSFDSYLTGQSGAVIAPAQIKAKDGKHLIGTGPFICKDDCWIPNQKTVLVKNPTYWRKGLPKLDSIEFRPIPDEDQRLAQLQNGQVQFILTANYLTGRDMAKLEKEKKIKLEISENFGTTSYDYVNLAKPGPMQDVRVRQAWAAAVDLPTLRDLRAPGATVANGIFPKGATGYVEDTGYPTFDLDKAKALLDAYKKDKGVSKVEVTLQTTAVADNQQTIAVMKQMLDKAGFTINLGAPLEQSAYIGAVFVGGYEVMTWNYAGWSNPDQGRPFLHSEGCGGPIACPRTIGTPVLNWGRMADGIIDSSLDQIRTNSDPVVRKKAAENINRQLGSEALILFRWRSRAHFGGCAKCGGLTDFAGPKGEKPSFLPAGGFYGAAELTVG
jgi:peptide/nickel transport system substrate-binding protein